MHVTFLGTGDAFSEKMGHNSALVEWGGTNLLIDCPDTNYTRIKNLDFTYEDIEHIFITHLHADHINGLEKFAHYRSIMTPKKEKPTLYVPALLVQPLWEALKQGLMYSRSGEKTLDDYFHVVAVRDTFEIEGVTFQIIQTEHIPGMLSYGLLANNHFYFSGDSCVNESFLKEIEEQVSVIFHDCHLWDLPIKSHASLDDLAGLSDELKNKLLLMHYDDRFENDTQIKGLELAKTKQRYLV